MFAIRGDRAQRHTGGGARREVEFMNGIALVTGGREWERLVSCQSGVCARAPPHSWRLEMANAGRRGWGHRNE